jgi:NAD+ synthase
MWLPKEDTSLSTIQLSKDITAWIKQYAQDHNMQSLVVGISGGIDSSVVSTLCAETQMPVHAVTMPIQQHNDQHTLSIDHGHWLAERYSNVTHHVILLDQLYNTFVDLMPRQCLDQHALANTKSRLRMVTLYQLAGSCKGIVVGTGNKVEDFGVGFYTKYGDGGVDISPIADLLKSEVWQLGKNLNILQSIIDAPPTDGLWEDGRTDKDQLQGLTYDQLEHAMTLHDDIPTEHGHSMEDKDLLSKYLQIRKPNLHKMNPIPIYQRHK